MNSNFNPHYSVIIRVCHNSGSIIDTNYQKWYYIRVSTSCHQFLGHIFLFHGKLMCFLHSISSLQFIPILYHTDTNPRILHTHSEP